jgi:hypothetical protein
LLILYCASVIHFYQHCPVDEAVTYIYEVNSVSAAGILMRKEQIAVIALAGWLTVLTVFMLVTQSVNLEILFVLSLIGCFIIVVQITPKYVRPGYLQYIRYVLVLGVILFGVIIALKIMQMLGLVGIVFW